MFQKGDREVRLRSGAATDNGALTMAFRYLLCVLVIVLMSCSALGGTESPLYETYGEYRQALNKDNVETRAGEFFSDELIGAVDLTEEEIQAQLLFHYRMSEQLDYFEVVKGDAGCLTVQGRSG